jgi:hypothetical protein
LRRSHCRIRSSAVAGRPPIARAAEGGNAGCTQPWPYYERACLGDSRKRSGNAHAVRVIALANPGAPHTPQARR